MANMIVYTKCQYVAGINHESESLYAIVEMDDNVYTLNTNGVIEKYEFHDEDDYDDHSCTEIKTSTDINEFLEFLHNTSRRKE